MQPEPEPNAPEADDTPEPIGTATYSPDDNKLRLYPFARLDKETYDRVKAAGFKWAPRQELFVAPMWTPEREDLLIELCGEIGDEDTSLVDRAEERAERFEDYSVKRNRDAERAERLVSAITDGIPLGQPILVGHHSEKRARKDQERIENGMRKAVKAWKTSQYWADRAAGAISHAKYKERADVRHRRIKTIEAEIRKIEGRYTPADNPPHIIEQEDRNGNRVPHVWCATKGASRGGCWVPVESLPRIKASYARWIEHYENRLAYEKAMLETSGGILANRWDIEVGGSVLVGGEWVIVKKVNKDTEGRIASVSTTARYVPVKGIEEVQDYKAPTKEQAARVKAATKQAPLCNYPGTVAVKNRWTGETMAPAELLPITKAEWDRTHTDYKATVEVPATETAGRHRIRHMIKGGRLAPVWLSDQKIKPAPAPEAAPEPVSPLPPPAPDLATLEAEARERAELRARQAEQSSRFEAMADVLKNGGVQAVSAPQLFPTPVTLAQTMAESLDLVPGATVLEPSAGSGRLARAVAELEPAAVVDCIEIKPLLAENLRACGFPTRCDDFLECNPEGRTPFDRVIMNPPFTNGQDIKHIRHAMRFLKPGGRLVALCANGPRQNDQLKPEVEADGGTWEPLPPGSFAESGTNVNVALIVWDKPDA